MDFTEWLPALTAMGAIGAAVITSRTAIRSAEKTARISLHAAYTTPRLTAVGAFLEAAEKGRHDPAKDILTAVEAAYLTVRILAFQGTEAAEEVRVRASALVENLREMQETFGAIPPAPAEQKLDELSHTVSRAEAMKQHQQETSAEAYDEWELHAREDYDWRRAALKCLTKSHADQIATYTHEGQSLKTVEARKELAQYGELINMPGLENAVETGKTLVWRQSARDRYQLAAARLWMDRKAFADAVASWLDEGPTT
ncbi:hypothetical protein ACFPK5_01000 [Streptomyces beijiangensis]|uniref:hypothetical protein n=1 Tax=Streptomyces beijiangensis TaxID=163361 RepID=UPI0031DD78DA